MSNPSKIARLRSRSRGPVIFTIGHSTRTITAFIRLLRAHGVQRVIDVRTMPRSLHNPQFNREQLSPALHRGRIHYKHMAGLGGLRRARRDSTNTGWRNASFRGYADYMQTAEFEASLDRCIALAKRERVALMCAEAVPWRCHRSLIADALIARGIEVSEITSAVRTRLHSVTPWARVDGTEVTYPRTRSSSRGARNVPQLDRGTRRGMKSGSVI
ncbi:MAG: DUF488 domain-containing protein [Acidobacteriota bacterium]|nr:DUF488 domain-containing protein [Acidobacteriota bacterium]